MWPQTGEKIQISAQQWQNTKKDNTESGFQGPGEPQPMFGLEPFELKSVETLQFRCSMADRGDKKCPYQIKNKYPNTKRKYSEI